MGASRGPVLLYVLPLLAVAVLGVSIFFTAGADEIRSALVLGGPTDGQVFHGRLQVTQETLGTAFPLTGEKIVIEAKQGKHRIERTGSTDGEGWLEFELPLRGEKPLSLLVSDAHGRKLAEGTPALSVKRWAASARRRGGQAQIQREGSLSVLLELENRILAVPFESRGRVVVKDSDRPLPGAMVNLSGTGVKVLGPAPKATGEDGTYSFLIAPEEHVASIAVEVRHDEKTFRFEQNVPVVPGAFGFRPEGKGYRILSPIPREEVWFTFVRDDERLAGGRLALADNQAGGAEALLTQKQVPAETGLYLVLASAADGRSPSTVGYPLAGQAQTFDAWDAYLIDGAPAARAVVIKKQRRVRWTLGAYAGLSGLLTLILFVAHVRRANHELAQRLEEVGATRDTREQSPLPLVIAVVCLFFAFSAGVLWIVAR